MIRRIAAQTALLAFTCALVAGLIGGNTPTTILTRALLAMLAGFALGYAVSLVARTLIREHLQRRKMAIDQGHVAALAAAPAGNETEGSATSERG